MKVVGGFINSLGGGIFFLEAPFGLSYIWNFGVILGIVWGFQVFLGVLLIFNYCVGVSLQRVEFLREPLYGLVVRFFHVLGGRFFFLVYLYTFISGGMVFKVCGG